MGKNSNIRMVPHYQELLDTITKAYYALNGDYPKVKQELRSIIERTEPERLHDEKYSQY